MGKGDYYEYLGQTSIQSLRRRNILPVSGLVQKVNGQMTSFSRHKASAQSALVCWQTQFWRQSAVEVNQRKVHLIQGDEKTAVSVLNSSTRLNAELMILLKVGLALDSGLQQQKSVHGAFKPIF